MSEINIQRKSGSNVLWWVLGLVALLIVAWLLFANMGTDTQTGYVVDPGSAVALTTIIDAYVV